MQEKNKNPTSLVVLKRSLLRNQTIFFTKHDSIMLDNGKKKADLIVVCVWMRIWWEVHAGT